jgi:tetratricopeptide (TPR) repeat protein
MEKIEINDNLISEELQNANKYIFVHDFLKADELLKQLCQKYENNFEIFFRRVEVASRSGTLDDLLFELNEQKSLFSKNLPLRLSYYLAKIKKFLEHKNNSLNNLENTNVDILFSKYDKIVRLPNKKIKIHRNVTLPDDIQISSLVENMNTQINFESSDIDDVLEKVFELYKKNSDHYAICYLVGFALNYLGNLEEAVHKWKKALNLNPNSVSTLSVLAELQQKSHFHDNSEDYCLRLESIDKYLVHGHIETHTELFNEFVSLKNYKNAIASLKILSDWIFRQYGSVPIEIEVICLLGSMNAYKLDNNLVASESCKNQVENIIISYKKSAHDLNHLIFIAEICEEYSLKNLAKICYYTVLTTPNADIELVKNVASHCVNHYSSEALLVNLKIAYKNSRGNHELRFCTILCSLHLNNINIVDYMDIKNRIRELISAGYIDKAQPFLKELISKFNDDPEAHYYLAEIYSREGNTTDAKIHFEQMYNLDPFNSESSIKYIYFLLRNKMYSDAIELGELILDGNLISGSQINDIRWSLAAAYFAEEDYEYALQEISKSIEFEPWNISYITLHLRCCLHLSDDSEIPETFSTITKLEEYTLEREKIDLDKKDKLVNNLVDYSLFCLRKGFFEIAWSFAKCALIVSKKLTEKINEALSRTAAAYLPNVTIPQLLILLKNQTDINVSFSEITSCVAKTYGLTGQWTLVDEWISMSQKANFTDKISQSKMFELEALSMAMQGTNFKKAQNLLEAAIDCYGAMEMVPFETKVLHGYIMVAQGNIADGIEKMKDSINENASIQSLYFFVKGLDRAGILSSISKESIEKMQNVYPLNSIEQKMIEEIFYTVSSKIELHPVGLAS